MTEGSAGDLSSRYWLAVAGRAGRRMLEHNMTMIASALAYSTFFAIPSVLLAVVGLFTLLAGPTTIDTLSQHLGQVMPAQATQLLRGSLVRLEQKPSAGLTLTIVGFALAFWSMTGAMTSYMTALNLAYGQKDSRPFVQEANHRARDGGMYRSRVPARRRAADLRAADREVSRPGDSASSRSSPMSGGPRSGRSWSPGCSPRSQPCSGSAPTSSTGAGGSSRSAVLSPSRSGYSPRARSRSTPPDSAPTTRPGARSLR